MGMFDDVQVFMQCPFCLEYGKVCAQTKDLERELSQYVPLPQDWFTSKQGKEFRTSLPVFPSFPLDKEHLVWENQAERREAQATPSPEFGNQLKYIIAYGQCPSCSKWIEGKIRLEDGKLIGEIYDVDLEVKDEK